MAISNTLSLSLPNSLYPKTSFNTQTTTASGVKPVAAPAQTGAQFSSASPQGIGATAIKGLVKPPATASAGTYKGVNITPGSDAQVAAQIAQINTPKAPTPQYTPPPAQTTPTAPVTAPTTPSPAYSPSNPPTFTGLVGATANQATKLNDQAANVNTTSGLIGSQGQVTQQEQDAKNKLAGLIGVAGDVNANIENHPSEFAFQMGREAVAGRNIEAMRQSLAAQSEAYATTRQANTQAYTGQANAQNQAGGLINSGGTLLNAAASQASPQAVPYNTQYLNPQTGQPIAGGGTGSSAMSQLPQQAQSAIQSYAQQVQNGSMTRPDAEQRLSAYGVAGTNALNEVLGTNFNTNASNASAGTTAQGQQIKTSADSTNRALDTLVSAFNSLPGWQTGGIPASNNIGQWIGQQFGDQALQSYKTNLADARSQLIGVLNSSGGTPTGNEATALQYLPENMTKAQFESNVGTQQNPGIVRQLVEQKVGAFTTSGQQNNQNQNGSAGGLYDY